MIFWDFDGMISGQMMYTNAGKSIKALQYGARHAISALRYAGFQQYIITGDSTEQGLSITKQIAKKLGLEVYTTSNASKLTIMLDKQQTAKLPICYCADDLYDVAIAQYVDLFITQPNTLPSLQKLAWYVTKTDPIHGYPVMEIAEHLLAYFSDQVTLQTYARKGIALVDMITKLGQISGTDQQIQQLIEVFPMLASVQLSQTARLQLVTLNDFADLQAIGRSKTMIGILRNQKILSQKHLPSSLRGDLAAKVIVVSKPTGRWHDQFIT